MFAYILYVLKDPVRDSFIFPTMAIQTDEQGAGKMTHRVNILVARTDDLSLIPGTHMVEKRTKSQS